MAFAIKSELSGMQDVMRRLNSVHKSLRSGILKKATSAGGKVLARATKKLVPKSTETPLVSGLLRKSIGMKLRVYNGGDLVLAVVGPRTGFRVAIGVRKSGKSKGKTFYQNPVAYAHLVELGTRHSAAKPFLRPAFESSKDFIAETMRQVIEEGISSALSSAP